MRIDLNADVGESGATGADQELIPLVTSVNVACGAHAGDPLTMERTVALAKRHGVAIGAHPGYPDRDGFGRRDLAMTPDELEVSILAQLGALSAFTRSGGADLVHVKPHGALYNRAARDPALAAIVARAVRRFSQELVLIGLAGSALIDAGGEAGLRVASEAFADRAYERDGSLRSRQLPGALHEEPAVAAAQAVAIGRDRRVRSHDGTEIPIDAETLCVHGDSPGAPAIARAVRDALIAAGIEVRSLDGRLPVPVPG